MEGRELKISSINVIILEIGNKGLNYSIVSGGKGKEVRSIGEG